MWRVEVPRRKVVAVLAFASVATAAGTATATDLTIALQCGPGLSLLPNAKTDSQVRGARVEYDQGSWRITYLLANNSVIERNQQYDIRDNTGGTSTSWFGKLRKNPSLAMQGEIRRDTTAEGYLYLEWLYDGTHGSKMIGNTVAKCNATYGPTYAKRSPAPSPPPASPPTPQPNPEVEGARDKIIKEAMTRLPTGATKA